MSMNFYPDEVHAAQLGEPHTTPAIDEACIAIFKACKGMGTDEEQLISILGDKTSVERSLIAYRYKHMYDEDLADLLKSEEGGDFGFLLRLLAVGAPEADCEIIRQATKGAGTKERLLYSVICGRSNEEIQILRKTYFKRFNKDLVSVIDSEVGGDMKKLLLACLQGMEEEYDASHHNAEQAKKDAKAFYKAGQGKKLGTDEAILFEILCKSPPQYLKLINAAYVENHDVTLKKALEKELRGDVEDAAVFTLGMKLQPHETIAELIKATCKGIGTDEDGLSSAVVRFQHILPSVEIAHVELFGKTIADRIRKETSGDYESLLLKVAGAK